MAEKLPRQAREGLMRAWITILRKRHPGVGWVPVDPDQGEGQTDECVDETTDSATDDPATDGER